MAAKEQPILSHSYELKRVLVKSIVTVGMVFMALSNQTHLEQNVGRLLLRCLSRRCS